MGSNDYSELPDNPEFGYGEHLPGIDLALPCASFWHLSFKTAFSYDTKGALGICANGWMFKISVLFKICPAAVQIITNCIRAVWFPHDMEPVPVAIARH